ncbi:hypothetical protein VTL71DRAFT_13112 [Oculimacula yallundae]|uniref:Enoyl reductase (ER) domain-containing protein n=1 Tax=Oculimacula yallundae TaxID=86028 RepID=A0ABR4CQ03_9HELO
MDSLPATQTAIIGLENGTLTIAKDVRLPKLQEDMILVKTKFVGLNPVDTKMVGRLVIPGAIVGTDFAGHVVAIGSKALCPGVKIGDRVAGVVQSSNPLQPDVGGFTEYIGATGFVTMKIPDAMSFDEGAAIGSGIGTMGMALFHSLDIPGYPTEPALKPKYVLVYGGSSATGTMAIQLIKLCGLIPIATSSEKNFPLVESYGAEKVFDYHLPSCPDDIKSYTKNSLKFVVDCISEPETMEFCYKCIGRAGGKYTALEPFPSWLDTKKTVKADWVFGPMMLGKKIGWPAPFEREADEELRKFSVKWFATARQLLQEGKIRAHPLKSMPGGFPGVLEGMEILRKKELSGVKLVYQVG